MLPQQRLQEGDSGDALWRGLEWAGGAGRGERARTEGRHPRLAPSEEQTTISPSMNPPPTAVLEPRPHPRAHSQFLNQHHLPGTPSQLLPLPPPPLPPLTAPARPRPQDHRPTSAPARPHPSGRDLSRQRAREGLGPPQFRAPPWARETFTAVARPAGRRVASTATAHIGAGPLGFFQKLLPPVKFPMDS